eukprot:2229116-Alexandrium_andersonii.AAC.1
MLLVRGDGGGGRWVAGGAKVSAARPCNTVASPARHDATNASGTTGVAATAHRRAWPTARAAATA